MINQSSGSRPFARRVGCGRLFLAITLLGPLVPAFAQRADKIVPQDGDDIRGRIQNVSQQTVTINAKGKDTDIAANTIRYITFGDEPVALRQAREAIDSGQFEQAEKALARIASGDVKSEWVKQEFAFLKARLKSRRAESGAGEPAAAAKAIIEFLKNHKQSYHYYEAVQALGDMAMQAGSYHKAAKYYEQLGKAPWPEYKMLADVLTGNALRAQGKAQLPGALQRYDAVLAASPTNEATRRQQYLATAGKAACQAALGDVGGSIDALEKIVAEAESTDVELHARVNNALGDCYRSAGQNTDAALAYLHTHLLFFKDSAAHAEALYQLSQVWSDLGKPAEATRARDLLRSRYGGSSWAKR